MYLLGDNVGRRRLVLKGLISHMPNAFSVGPASDLDPRVVSALRSNPGLELANAFGVIAQNSTDALPGSALMPRSYLFKGMRKR